MVSLEASTSFEGIFNKQFEGFAEDKLAESCTTVGS